MARIHRFSGYYVDAGGRYTTEDIRRDLNCAMAEQLHVETSPDFAWSSALPEAKYNCDLAHLAKHFLHNSDGADAKDVKIGGYYRHFKGKMVHVIAVARNTETQELSVVYAADDGTGVWNRPLWMFLSEVDHEKYPDVQQKMRFELFEMH